MKRYFSLFLIISLFFGLCSCKSQNTQEPTTVPVPTTVVSNIYITDEGIFTDVIGTSTEQTQPATTMPPQTEPVTSASVSLTTQATELPLSQYTAQMVLDKIVSSVNFAKEQRNFSAHLLQEVEIKLTDCTLSWAVPVINGAIGVFVGPHEAEYAFVNGTCPDPKEDYKMNATPLSAIPPSNRLFALEVGGITQFSAYEESGEYVYTVTLPFEFTNSETLVPFYHAQALDYLDLSDFDFGIGEITNAECYYPGATVTVRLDRDGNLLKYEETIPMYGSGTGKLGIELSASFEGSMYECWTFEW